MDFSNTHRSLGITEAISGQIYAQSYKMLNVLSRSKAATAEQANKLSDRSWHTDRRAKPETANHTGASKVERETKQEDLPRQNDDHGQVANYGGHHHEPDHNAEIVVAHHVFTGVKCVRSRETTNRGQLIGDVATELLQRSIVPRSMPCIDQEQ